MTSKIKLKVGDKVELNNGAVHEVTHMFGDDPLSVDDYGFGPFCIQGWRYHQDGRFANGGYAHELSVGSVIANADTPTIWRDMTPEEKGALLLAHHEGKVIEYFSSSSGWIQSADAAPGWFDMDAYRIKPEPKRETVKLTGGELGGYGFYQHGGSNNTHRITFDTIDGEIDCEKCPACGTSRHVDMEPINE